MSHRQPGRWWLPVVLLLVIGVNPTTVAYAHETRPALLQMTEQPRGRFEVLWKVPTRGDRVLHLKPLLPPRLTRLRPSPVPGSSARPTRRMDSRWSERAWPLTGWRPCKPMC